MSVTTKQRCTTRINCWPSWLYIVKNQKHNHQGKKEGTGQSALSCPLPPLLVFAPLILTMHHKVCEPGVIMVCFPSNSKMLWPKRLLK
uniref:Putative endonuclease/reverse transcript n=1 Tax=Ixodes ricinus TaxID=34613 RepID=A0A0K8RKG9_IXORI